MADEAGPNRAVFYEKLGGLALLVGGIAVGAVATRPPIHWFFLAIGFDIALLGVVLFVAGVAGQDRTPSVAIPEGGADHESPPIARFEAQADAELAVTLLREEFHPVQSQMNVGEFRITVRNRTAREKQITCIGCQLDPPETAPHRHLTRKKYDEVDVRQAIRPPLPTVIAPHGTESGWHVVALPWRVRGGIVAFTLQLEDEVGTMYRCRRPSRD
jgi:hypothetical protein